MMVRFDPKAEELRHLRVGPLGPHVESFAALLSRLGLLSREWLAEDQTGG